MMLNGGFFRLPNDLPKPVWRYSMYYIAFYKYANQGFYKNEFLGLIFPNTQAGGPPSIIGDEISRETWQVEMGYSKWIDLAILFGMVILYRLMLGSGVSEKGDILINGQRQKLAFGDSAYVTQDDVLMTTLTVREAVCYSAQLQLPDSMSRSEKRERAEATIREMGLEGAMDTRIGGWATKGISGGQKRRVSICIELLTRPQLLFLDEPTSGLDSAASYHVMDRITRLARREGMTVVAAIHQPSSEVFELFHGLCLLAYGRTVFIGPASMTNEFFASNGFPCPSLRNPSDHYLRTINKDFEQDIEEDLESKPRSTSEAIDILVKSYRSSATSQQVAQQIAEIRDMGGVVVKKKNQASFMTQSLVLTGRCFVNMYMDLGYYWLRFAIYIALCLCVGTIYHDVGHSFGSIHLGCSMLMLTAAFLTFMAIGGFPSFAEDTKIFGRERLNGHYGVTAFTIANTLSATPYLALISVIPGAMAYYLVSLQRSIDHFIYFALVLFMCMMLVEGLMMIVASIVPDFLMGIITGAGIQGVMMLNGGFFRLPNDLPKPVWRCPMYYIAFHKYANQRFYKNEFLGLIFPNTQAGGPPTITGDEISRETWQVEMGYFKWIDLAILFGMVILYRLMFLGIVKTGEGEAHPQVTNGRLGSGVTQKGDILINGQRQKLAFGSSAYVTQDDVLMTTLTVREAVYYSAQLQLPDSMSRSEKRERAEATIREMGLEGAMDTRIGGWAYKGISGGQKRRVSICIELLTRPQLLFLDEPTSGLDSAASYHVMDRITRLARREGMTVVAAIHQPSSEVFQLFHGLCLLAYGRTVFFGAASMANEVDLPVFSNSTANYQGKIIWQSKEGRGHVLTSVVTLPPLQFFASNGFPCSPLRNPSDHYLRTINKDFDKDIEEDYQSNPRSTAEAIEILVKSYRSSVSSQQVTAQIEEIRGMRIHAHVRSCIPNFHGYWRLPSFVEDMKIFGRERLNGHYGVTVFTIANTLSATPYLALISVIPGAIAYYLVGLQRSIDHFIYFALVLFMCMMLVEGLMMIVASIVPDFLMGIITGAGIQGVMMLNGGFFRLPNDLPKPVWRYPMYYIAFHKYANQGFYKNEFLGLIFPNTQAGASHHQWG
ncbi:ABC-2 type transporter [Musa troglodytarum]|uniref:ABC-2 type transporter n=1 Tax=Musa troglodytarum TaxID=320322 RepID=A0A9E7FZW9_9LILI|nr:ABC-2 type transporter [Musa troglodytarum]